MFPVECDTIPRRLLASYKFSRKSACVAVYKYVPEYNLKGLFCSFSYIMSSELQADDATVFYWQNDDLRAL